MKMPGMGEMPDLSEIPKEVLDRMPNLELMMGKPQRLLNVRLWSPGIADPDATAWLAPPDVLKQGPRLDLELYRPQPVTPGHEGETGPGEGGMPPEFTIKIYWGSSETVKPGQPKVITFGGATMENRAQIQRQARAMQAMGQMLSSMGLGGVRRGAVGGDYTYKPDWTTGYWPTEKQPGEIADDASLVGTFALTSFCGNVSLDVPSNVTFLAPIELVSPGFSEMPSLDDALALKWNPIPNLLGIHAMIMGIEGKTTMILWLSSEVLTDETTGLDWDYLQMAEVRDLVAKTVLMKGDDTDATVPKGIFKNCDMVMMQMIGYGPGVALNQAQPLPRLQTKTTFSSMLGGKGMPRG
jgi:hypothetical protein